MSVLKRYRDLIVVARRGEHLSKLATRLDEAHAVMVRVI